MQTNRRTRQTDWVSEIRNRITGPHSCMSDREAQATLARRERASRAQRPSASHMQFFIVPEPARYSGCPTASEPITRPEQYQWRISLDSHKATVVSRVMFAHLWPILNTITTSPSAFNTHIPTFVLLVQDKIQIILPLPHPPCGPHICPHSMTWDPYPLVRSWVNPLSYPRFRAGTGGPWQTHVGAHLPWLSSISKLLSLAPGGRGLEQHPTTPQVQQLIFQG